MTGKDRPSLQELIDEAAKLPPGPEVWAPIFRHYPELTAEELAAKFRQNAERCTAEAEELRVYQRQRTIAAFLEQFHWMVDPGVDPIRTKIREFFVDYIHCKGSEGGTTEEGQVAFDAAVARDPQSWPLPIDRLHALWRDTTQVLNKLPSALTRSAQLVWLGSEAGHGEEIIDAALCHEFPLFTPLDIAAAYKEAGTHMLREAAARRMEVAIFQAWADLETARGRAQEELLFGACIDALGIAEKTADGRQYLNFQKLKDIADPELRRAVLRAAWEAGEEAALRGLICQGC